MANDKASPIVGIDLGGTSIKGGLVDVNGKILRRTSLPTEAHKDKETVFGNIKKVISELITDECIGIGMGSPGCINTQTGQIVGNIQNIPALNGFPMGERLNQEFGLPAFVDNDATNAVKGEFLFGAGRGYRNILCITLGTGIGGGLILNGKVFHGTNDFAGEVGHMILVPSGKTCNCGNNGCFEMYSSATAMIKRAEDYMNKKVPSSLLDYKTTEVTAKLISDLAQDGDVVCQDILWEAAHYIGLALGNISNLLNLDCIIIGGGVAAAGDILFKHVEMFTQKYSIPFIYEQLTIVPAQLGNDAGIYGSAAMVLLEGGHP